MRNKTIYTARIVKKLRAKPYRQKMLPVKKHGQYLHNGPWAGQVLWLSSLATAELNINGQKGRYFGGNWEPSA